jgi:hypothetical protein
VDRAERILVERTRSEAIAATKEAAFGAIVEMVRRVVVRGGRWDELAGTEVGCQVRLRTSSWRGRKVTTSGSVRSGGEVVGKDDYVVQAVWSGGGHWVFHCLR